MTELALTATTVFVPGFENPIARVKTNDHYEAKVIKADGEGADKLPTLMAMGFSEGEARKQLMQQIRSTLPAMGLTGTIRFVSAPVAAPVNTDGPTEPQVKYFLDMLHQMSPEANMQEQEANFRAMTRAKASETLNAMKPVVLKLRAEAKAKAQAAPVAQAVTVTKTAATEGMHKVGDRIFKVQKAVYGSGYLYAKELVKGDTKSGFTFAHAPGAMKLLSGETKMTMEQAKEFGTLYGTCCVCGRLLTDEKSIAAGIGPVCAEKGGW